MPDTLYDTDPHAWAMREADKLRGVARLHPKLGLDFPHLIEELDGMAGADRQRVESLAGAVMQHLLLLEHSPAKDPRRHWQSEVVDYRTRLRRALTGTLTNHLVERMDAVFDDAREAVRLKMAFYGEDDAAKGLPTARPYTFEQLLDRHWWPPAPGAQPQS
ncbi:MAG: DUF29 domain-containing protein [Geminicoccaceae bacterium]|nr:DUF29 domain-containing protein [Geminicoccaceae bacterium]